MKKPTILLGLTILVLIAAGCIDVPPSCSDGILNGNETGIDCGGSCDNCTETDDVCAQVITYGVGPDGQCQEFSTACMPEGWISVSECKNVCPESCDDSNPCTADYCNTETGDCVAIALNGDQTGCSGSQKMCTVNSCGEGVCVASVVEPCCGDDVCGEGETCTDCLTDCGICPEDVPKALYKWANGSITYVGSATFDGRAAEKYKWRSGFDEIFYYYLIDGDGDVTLIGKYANNKMEDMQYWLYVNQPLYIGRIWANNLAGGGAVTYTVASTETVGTPAGQFESYKIIEENEATGETRDIYWSNKIKSPVKIVLGDGTVQYLEAKTEGEFGNGYMI